MGDALWVIGFALASTLLILALASVTIRNR